MDLFNVNSLGLVFSSGGLVLLAITAVLYADYFFNQRKLYLRYVAPYVFIVAVATTVGSMAIALLYSEYFNFVPCSLCWLQRIAMFPQALFAVMALKTKEGRYFPLYSLALSFFGLAVSVYHYIDQQLPKAPAETGSLLPCLVDGSGDCAVKVINEFGFVTFPFLTAVVFAFLIILYLNMRKSAEQN
jgi:disulfide bond formation protein DsbB